MDEPELQPDVHDQNTNSVSAAERAAMKSVIEARGERATHAKIREERDAHFQQQLDAMSGNVKVNWPAINAPGGTDSRGKDPRPQNTINAEFAIAGGRFAVIDFAGSIREYID